ncbi:MAG: glycosyltransferase [Legionella sp.]|nr:glycosyltransferase [Legionella sp.]
MEINHLCILIPAKDEEEFIARCLHAILNALHYVSIPTSIVLGVDSSTDKTAVIGRKILSGHGTVLEMKQQNVGATRRIITEYALAQIKGYTNNCWLAHTDADCQVPENWLSLQLELATQGIQGITGIVKVDNYREHSPTVQKLFEDHYQINRDGTHPHVHGANFGCRADAYIKAGGWNELLTGEDHDLWNRLKQLKIPLKSAAELYVTTSGRLEGRAPMGFAQKLASFNDLNRINMK